MKDIENKADIEILINEFYDKVKMDDTIGYIFKQRLTEAPSVAKPNKKMSSVTRKTVPSRQNCRVNFISPRQTK